jgi:hypothetical protein
VTVPVIAMVTGTVASGARRMARVRPAALAAIGVVLLLGGCTPHPVGPARTDAAYDGKARTTVEGALSAVQSARLVVEASDDGNTTSVYAAMVLSEQEGAVDGLAGTFRSIQPPSGASDHVGAEVADLLGDATDHLTAARIAARRGGGEPLHEVGPDLEDDAKALEDFLQEHGG